MKFGLKEETVVKIQTALSQFSEVDKAILYGSRAKGTERPGSDIDLTLFGKSLTFTVLNQIRSALDDLNLPYTFDLSIHSDIENAALLEHIDRVGCVFYLR